MKWRETLAVEANILKRSSNIPETGREWHRDEILGHNWSLYLKCLPYHMLIKLHIPWYDHLMSSFYHVKATVLYCSLSLRSSYSLCSQPDDRLHTYSRSNHKRWKSIETQDDLKSELIMNNTLYTGAGGNHIWGIENWIYFSLKDRKHKAEVVNPLHHWWRVARVWSAHQKRFRRSRGHVFVSNQCPSGLNACLKWYHTLYSQ